MTPPKSLPTRQIGKLGELLVQYKLLQYGIESAPLTTDAGIDLVAYGPNSKKAITIQVKTNLKPKPGGGKGRPYVNWWVEDDNPAKIFALVDISTEKIWILTKREFENKAQQHSSGRRQLYMALTPKSLLRGKIGRSSQVLKYKHYLFENRIYLFLGK